MSVSVTPSGQHFSVDLALATAYGLEEAFLIHHFQHWIRLNKTRGINFKHGRTWTYQTIQEIADHFPFLNYEKVKYALEILENEGVILKGNYNKSPIDKTTWYAFVNEEIYVPELPQKSKSVYERENSLSTGKIPSGEGKFPHIPDTKTPDTKQLSCSVPSEVVPPSGLKISKVNSKKEAIEVSIDEIFYRALREKKDWSTPEIEEAWEILRDCPNPVNDPFAMIDGIIKNIRLKKNKTKQTKKQPVQSEKAPRTKCTEKAMSQEELNKLLKSIGVKI